MKAGRRGHLFALFVFAARIEGELLAIFTYQCTLKEFFPKMTFCCPVTGR